MWEGWRNLRIYIYVGGLEEPGYIDVLEGRKNLHIYSKVGGWEELEYIIWISLAPICSSISSTSLSEPFLMLTHSWAQSSSAPWQLREDLLEKNVLPF